MPERAWRQVFTAVDRHSRLAFTALDAHMRTMLATSRQCDGKRRNNALPVNLVILPSAQESV
jgi:hypothetical protein